MVASILMEHAKCNSQHYYQLDWNQYDPGDWGTPVYMSVTVSRKDELGEKTCFAHVLLHFGNWMGSS